MSKKPKPEPAATEPAIPAAEPWSCSECGAPGLAHAFRVKNVDRCWTCFFASPRPETATFVVRPAPAPTKRFSENV